MIATLEKIKEEFNLGRDLRFRGNIEQATLFLVHELDSRILEASKKRMVELGPFKKIIKVHIDDLETKISEFKDKDNLATMVVHLALDNEINNHRKISNQILSHNVFQINPYNKIAKIFDDKYLFYALMTANAIKQPLTHLTSANNSSLDFAIFDQFDKLYLKPRYGTEAIDCLKIDSLSSKEAIEHMHKIHAYDDCIIQEALEFSREFKVLYFHGRFFAKDTIDKGLKSQLNDFIDLLDDYALRNHVIMPEIFSLDILETMDRGFVFLEANIRPAAIHKF